jgi:hypothetical protein
MARKPTTPPELKEARALLRLAKQAGSKSWRTRRERAAAALLAKVPADKLRPRELEVAATAAKGRALKKIEGLIEERAQAREEAKARKREKDAQAKRAKRAEARKLAAPFGVEREIDAEGRGVGVIVRAFLAEAGKRTWCAAGEVQVRAGARRESDDAEDLELESVVDLARLTAAEGGVVADLLLNRLIAVAFAAEKRRDKKRPKKRRKLDAFQPNQPPPQYRRGPTEAPKGGGAKPANEATQALLLKGARGRLAYLEAYKLTDLDQPPILITLD